MDLAKGVLKKIQQLAQDTKAVSRAIDYVNGHVKKAGYGAPRRRLVRH
jgi:hypothetical protein